MILEKITKNLIDLIAINARISELERSRPYVSTQFFYVRKSDLLLELARVTKYLKETGVTIPDVKNTKDNSELSQWLLTIVR